MAKNVFGDEIEDVQTNAFGDPIESAVGVLAEPLKEPLPPEMAFDRAGKVWDAAIENDVPLNVAQEWFFDAEIIASDPDSFADPIPDNRTGFSENFIREWTTEKAITKLPIAGGVIGLARNAETIQAANRLLDAEFDYDAMNRRMREVHAVGMVFGGGPFVPSTLDEDRRRIANAIKDFEFQSRAKTFGGKVAVGISQLPTWMIEFAATGGLASLGDDVAQRAGEKLLGKYVQTTAGKVVVKTAGLVTGAVVRTTAGLLPRVGEKASARQVLIEIGLAGEESWATSLAKAWGEVAIESLTEETGGIITKGLSIGLAKLPFGGKFMASLRSEWIKLTGGTVDNFATRMLTKGGYSTIIGEVGEERLATLLREATGVSDRRGNPFQRIWEGMKEDFEPENLGAEIVTLLAPASVRRGMTMGVSLTPGVSVPSEAEQLDQAVGVGPIPFDTPADAQGYADKATQVAERIGRDLTITVEPADNTVTVEEIVEEPAEAVITEPGPAPVAERPAPVTKPGVEPAKAPEAVVAPAEAKPARVAKTQNFTQFAKSQGAPSDFDITDHALLSPSGTISKRAKGQALERLLDRIEKNKQAHRDFEAAIIAGEIIDSEGKVTKESLEDEQKQRDQKKIDSRVSQIDTQIRNLKNVGIGKKGTIKPSFQKEIDSLEIEKAELLLPAEIAQPPTEIKPVEEIPEIPKAKRIISQEAFDAARKRFRDSTKLRTGLDPQQLADAAIIGGFLVESGVRNFTAWSKRMIEELGDRIKPHLQDIWKGIKAKQPKPKKQPKKKPVKKKVKQPEFPKDESVTEAERFVLGGVDPLIQILRALKQAKAVQPKTEAEKKAELSRRVGAAAGALRASAKTGTPTEEAIFKSSGLLKGPLTEYDQVFESIEDQLTPEAKEAAYAKIYSHPGLQYFEILNTAVSFKKLIQGVALTPGDVKNIENVFGKTFSDITKIRQQVSGLWERLIALWKAGLLTGLKTSGLNELSNASHAMSETASDIPASLVDRVASLFTGKRALAFTTKGYRAGVIQGIANGWKYLRTGYSERDIGKKLDHSAVFFGNSKFAQALQGYEEFIFHLLGAEDQPFYYGAKAKSLFSQAIAQGKNEGLKGKNLDAFVERLIKNPTDEMLRFAVHDAEVAVFQNRTGLGDAARLFQKINIAGVPVGQIIAPFGRTPAAVATQIISYTPVGIIGEVAAQIRKGTFNQRQFSQATGRAVIGTATLFIGGLLLKAGLMTLDRPRDERERKLWELEGRKANSIKIGGKWRTVQTLGPAGNVLLIGGHFQHQLVQEGSPTVAIAKAMSGSAKSFSEQTFVRGVNQAVSALVDPELSAEFWFTSMAGSLVPTIVADIARANDEIQRRTVGPVQRIQSRIPVLRESLPPRIDVFGQDLPRYGGNVLETMADPTRPSKIRNDVVVDELRRLADNDIKVTPTLLGDRKGFDILTVEENTQLWRRSGELTYKVLQAWIDNDSYKEIDNDFAKGKTIELLVRKTKAAAKAEVVGIKLRQGVSILKLAESGLLSIDGLDALQFFTK